MSDKVYAAADGFVQFDPRTREANGQTVRDVTIKQFGSQKLIYITVWPEFDDTEINKGDFVAVDGLYSSRVKQTDDGSPKEYINISAGSLVVVPGARKAERTVVSAGTASKKPAF